MPSTCPRCPAPMRPPASLRQEGRPPTASPKRDQVPRAVCVNSGVLAAVCNAWSSFSGSVVFVCNSTSEVSLTAMDDFSVPLSYSSVPTTPYSAPQFLPRANSPTNVMVSCNLPSFLSTNLCPRYNCCSFPWASFTKFVAKITNKASLPTP